MGHIHIDSIEPGMTLASDLMTSDGRFLLPKGTVFQEKNIRICKAWGIRRADIVGQYQDQLNAVRLAGIVREHLELSRLLLEPLLRCAKSDHLGMQEIVRIAVERTALELAAGKQPACKPEEMKPVPVPESCSATQAGGDQGAQELVLSQVDLITLPAVYGKIMEVLESPFSSTFHIAELVGKDSSLSAKLLKLVNSPLYGFSSRIDSIPRAVALLGTKELSSLALGISVVSAFDGIPSTVLDMEGFWKHSIGSAVYARLIASQVRGVSQERSFTGGLLHDLGWLIMIQSMPKQCAWAMYRSGAEGVPLYRVEREIFGYDHAQVGGLLCTQWRMPGSLAEMVRFHHEPDQSHEPAEAGILHLADILAMATGIATGSRAVLPPLSNSAWELIGMQPWDLDPMVRQAERQTGNILHIFFDRG